MSKPRPAYTGVLAHFQQLGMRPATFIPHDQAESLVRRMLAERISQKVVKLFPPQSIFLAGRADVALPDQSMPSAYIDAYLGLIFQLPQSPQWQAEHRIPTRELQLAAGAALKDWNEAQKVAHSAVQP